MSVTKFINPPHLRKRQQAAPLRDAETTLARFPLAADVCGIYFLLRGGVVVYIGQSVAIHARTRQHVGLGKEFDEYAILSWPQEGLNDKEAEMILKYDPPLNGGLPVNSLYISSRGIKHKAGTSKERVAMLIREAGVKPALRCSFGFFYLRSELEPIFGKLRRTSDKTPLRKYRTNRTAP